MLAQARSNTSDPSFQQVGMLRLAAPACAQAPMSTHERRLEALRARARQGGLSIRQSNQPLQPNNRGGLMILAQDSRQVLYGARYDLTLEQAEDLIGELLVRWAA
ncbi:hypothetical protein [Methylobacterium durans]|uniref:Uncharacterized protein n=1 Tax=Methylobacterium durans TaxID=2202825 RepID=A0A2U8WB69_9HYPH|nr:hypothetical protein [Methylobacterium durans]AWN43289.1 hypothetical protein DK389_25790 [Methylobacterium durans]